MFQALHSANSFYEVSPIVSFALSLPKLALSQNRAESSVTAAEAAWKGRLPRAQLINLFAILS